MFDIEQWLALYTAIMKKQFGERIWFMGLQGSFGRGEANEASDIDVVLILDSVSYSDLVTYSKLLDSLPHRTRVCGFVSGKNEIKLWDKSDLFQFCHDTTAIIGSLDELTRTISEDDIRAAIRLGACNIYHACVHNVVHAKSLEVLKALYKSAIFVLQAIVYLQNGFFVKKQANLASYLEPEDNKILHTSLILKNGSDGSFSLMAEMLINWSSKWIAKAKEL